MNELESLNSLSHKKKRKYDPVKRHEYYERTKKLKGRKKGRQKVPSIRTLRRKALLAKTVSSVQITPMLKNLNENILSRAEQVSISDAQAKLSQQKEENEKKFLEGLETTKSSLEDKKLDLESLKLDLDSKQTELDVQAKELAEIKRKKLVDSATIAKEERQILLAKSKLEIQKKKFDLAVKKLDDEFKKLDDEFKKLKSKPSYEPYLVHEYDPVKRHEYYERTKKLKGRKKGLAQVNTSSGNKKSEKTKTTEQKKAEIKARVTAYKARLEKLKEVLALLVEEAKQRSADNAGTKESRAERDKKENQSKKETQSTKETGTSKKTGSSTAKEKAAAKEYYEKNKEKISLKKQESNLKDQIKEVEEKIVKIRAELKDSIKKARNKQRNSK